MIRWMELTCADTVGTIIFNAISSILINIQEPPLGQAFGTVGFHVDVKVRILFTNLLKN